MTSILAAHVTRDLTSCVPLTLSVSQWYIEYTTYLNPKYFVKYSNLGFIHIAILVISATFAALVLKSIIVKDDVEVNIVFECLIC